MNQSKIIAVLLLAALIGCRENRRPLTAHSLVSPAPDTSLTPQVTPLGAGRLLMSWQTPLQGGGYSFSMSIFDGRRWSEIRPIASGPRLSMFSADLPGVALMPNGQLFAYWELKDSREDNPYATAIQTAVSKDEGKSWSPPLQPYGDILAGQHSFLSWFPSSQGLGLVWLDAQQQAQVRHAALGSNTKHEREIGAIGLRYAAFNREGKPAQGSFIAPIACECCPTSAALTSRGPVVVYRGRQDPPGTKPADVECDRPTIRDIYIARLESRSWTRPHAVHTDNWVVNACPDNGPAVDAAGDKLAVAWWTRSSGSPKVQVAFSRDAGDTFGQAFRIDAGKAEGQVTVALLSGGDAAVVGWLEAGRTWARLVSASGVSGQPVELGASPRHSRLPRWIAEDGEVFAVWTSQIDGVRRVSVSRIKL